MLASISPGNLFFADQFNNRIRKVNTNGIISTVAGSGTNGYLGDGGLATNASLNFPDSVSVDHSGNLFIADSRTTAFAKLARTALLRPWRAGVPATAGRPLMPPLPALSVSPLRQ